MKKYTTPKAEKLIGLALSAVLAIGLVPAVAFAQAENSGGGGL